MDLPGIGAVEDLYDPSLDGAIPQASHGTGGRGLIDPSDWSGGAGLDEPPGEAGGRRSKPSSHGYANDLPGAAGGAAGYEEPGHLGGAPPGRGTAPGTEPPTSQAEAHGLMDVRHITIAMRDVPTEPEAIDDEGLRQMIKQVLASKISSRIYGLFAGPRALGRIKDALRIERQRASALDRYFHAMHQNIGKAWLRAGSPPGLGVDLPDHAETDEGRLVGAQIQGMERERCAVADMFDARLRLLEQEHAQLVETTRGRRSDLAALDEACGQLERGGAEEAPGVVAMLPGHLIRTVAQAAPSEVWPILLRRQGELRTELATSEAKVADLMAERDAQEEERARQMEAISEEVDALQESRIQLSPETDDRLRSAGEQLVPKASAFANGREFEESFQRALQVRDETLARTARLERAEARARQISLSERVQRRLVLAMATLPLLVAAVYLVVRSAEDVGNGARLVRGWMLPADVDLTGEVRYRELAESESFGWILDRLQESVVGAESASMILQMDVDLPRIRRVGFAGLTRDHQFLLMLPGSYDSDDLLDDWARRGRRPTLVRMQKRQIHGIDSKRAMYFGQPGELWIGDPDLMEGSFAAADERARSLESREGTVGMMRLLGRDGCLWVHGRVEVESRSAALFRRIGLKVMPDSFNLELRCGEMGQITLTLYYAEPGALPHAEHTLKQVFAEVGGEEPAYKRALRLGANNVLITSDAHTVRLDFAIDGVMLRRAVDALAE